MLLHLQKRIVGSVCSLSGVLLIFVIVVYDLIRIFLSDLGCRSISLESFAGAHVSRVVFEARPIGSWVIRARRRDGLAKAPLKLVDIGISLILIKNLFIAVVMAAINVRHCSKIKV